MAREHTVEIGDKSGRSFKIHITTPNALTRVIGGLGGNWEDTRTGSWRTIDKGFLRYNGGKSIRDHSDKDLTTFDLYLLGLKGISVYWLKEGPFGIKLFEYDYFTGTNHAGEGFVVQPWVLGIDVGKISWTLVD